MAAHRGLHKEGLKKPDRRGRTPGLFRFLYGGTCDGEGKPTTTRQLEASLNLSIGKTRYDLKKTQSARTVGQERELPMAPAYPLLAASRRTLRT
jgi:hypothetical protein